MKKWKEAAAFLLGLALFLGITYGMGGLLLPTRAISGATWGQFLQEERNCLDVLYLGSSVVYCDVIPAAVWSETGLTSYCMAGPEQPMSITYHYLRQACATQSPQAVAVELNSLFFPKATSSVKPNLLYMPWGVERILATLHSAAPEDLMELLFPLCGSHSEVYNVTFEQLQERMFPPADQFAGYTLLTRQIPPVKGDSSRFDEINEDIYRDGIAYLRKISEFCGRRGIKLLLFFAPIYCDVPQDTLDRLERDLEAIPHDRFLNCNGGAGLPLDPQTQWFDWLHLNVYGAEPFSRRLAQELKALGLTTQHGGDDALWRERYAAVAEQWESQS